MSEPEERVEGNDEDSRAEALRAMGLREVEIDLKAEGQAIGSILNVLGSLPDSSQHRVIGVVLRLVLSTEEKSSLQQSGDKP